MLEASALLVRESDVKRRGRHGSQDRPQRCHTTSIGSQHPSRLPLAAAASFAHPYGDDAGL